MHVNNNRLPLWDAISSLLQLVVLISESIDVLGTPSGFARQ